MSSTLKKLAIEGRLAKSAWCILVYLQEHHRAGHAASNLEALQLSPAVLTKHTEHLEYRGFLVSSPNGGWALSPALRKELAVDVSINREPDNRHPFLRRDRETQRRALKFWHDTGKRLDLLKPLVPRWKSGSLAGADQEALDRAEQVAASLPPEPKPEQVEP